MMSIGLKDLDKKRLAKRVQKQTAKTEAQAKQNSTFRKQSARPWSHADLSRSQAFMNEDWSRMQAAPLFWVDFSEHSAFMRAQTKLVEIENRVHDLFNGRLAPLLSTFKLGLLRARS